MKKFKENEGILVGAKVHPQLAEDFKNHCRKEKFNQRLLFSNFLKWWLSLDLINQEHIYRGRMNQVFAFEDEAAAARNTSEKKRSKGPKPSKVG